MSGYIVNQPTLSYNFKGPEGQMMSGVAKTTSATALTQAPGGGALGAAGMGAQVVGQVFSAWAEYKGLSEQKKRAKDELHFTSSEILDRYTQLFQQMGEQNRRMYAQQDVAVATSGLAMDGSVKAVLDETVRAAKEQSRRMGRQMESELAAAQYRARKIRQDATRAQKYGVIKAAINIGGSIAGMGG